MEGCCDGDLWFDGCGKGEAVRWRIWVWLIAGNMVGKDTGWSDAAMIVNWMVGVWICAQALINWVIYVLQGRLNGGRQEIMG